MRGRRAGEWTGEMTSGRIRTRVLHGPQARMWCVVGATACATVPPVLCYFKFFLSGLLCYAVVCVGVCMSCCLGVWCFWVCVCVAFGTILSIFIGAQWCLE